MRRAIAGSRFGTVCLVTLIVTCLIFLTLPSPFATLVQASSQSGPAGHPADVRDWISDPDTGIAIEPARSVQFAPSSLIPSTLGPSTHESLTADSSLTINVFTGAMRSRVIISNPEGITGIREYQNANFSQRIISQSATRVELETASVRFLDTQAPFPVQTASLPDEALQYLTPMPGWIQSDDPAIQNAAFQLTRDASLQAQAVDAIVAYVRGNTVYDYRAPLDALSVFQTGRAYCVGFANLTEALLRAAGIPARAQYGCVGPWDGWAAPIEGGRHVWVQIYYPDVGWVSCDPQVSANFIDTAHIVGFLDQSGREGTIIERVDYEGSLGTTDKGYLYSLRAPLTTRAGIPLCAPTIPAWDRYPIAVQPTEATVDLSPETPLGWLDVDIDANDSVSSGWRIESDVPWMQPEMVGGVTPNTVRVDIDGTNLVPGTHVGTLTIMPTSGESLASAARTVTVTLQMASAQPTAADAGGGSGGTYRLCLPVIVRRH